MARKLKLSEMQSSSNFMADASAVTMKKPNSRTELSKQDLIQLLTCLEGELQARDVVIATLKMEKVKQVVKLAQQGRLSKGLGAPADPFAALQRDSSYAVLKTTDASSLEEESSVYDNQLEKLEQLILQQRKAMSRLTSHMKQAEKLNSKLVGDVEEERRKHPPGGAVVHVAEKERARLAQELETEQEARMSVEKELKKVKETLEDERNRQQQIVLLLVAERNKIIMKWIEERRRSEDLAQILAEEKGRVDSMAEGLEEESKKALLMEAELERMAAQCNLEQRQFRTQLEMKEKRCKELEIELEKVRAEADSFHKQLAEAHQVAMFQAGQQQNSASPAPSTPSPPIVTGRMLSSAARPLGSPGLGLLGTASPPIPNKPTVIPPGPQIPQRTLSVIHSLFGLPVPDESSRRLGFPATLPSSSPKLGAKGVLRPVSPSNLVSDDHGSPLAAGVASSVTKTVQPTASVSSVPVSGPATGIAQSVIRPAGIGTLRGVAYSTAAGSPGQGMDSHVSPGMPGRIVPPPLSSPASHDSNDPSKQASAAAAAPGGSRVAVSASSGSKVYSSTSQGKVTFHVTTTMASRGGLAGARGMPPPVPPNKPQIQPKKMPPGASAVPITGSEVTVDRGQPISFEVNPQKVGQQALKFGITISKDKIHITNAQGAAGGPEADDKASGGQQAQMNPSGSDETPSSSTDAVENSSVVTNGDEVENEEPIYTLQEVLDEELELQENADEVLAGSDDKNCSYTEGYIKRQALYACITCTREGNRAGVCLACSYACHADHELVELYTKRNFRCDCGNGRMKQPCKLMPAKEAENELNKYNQNFDGVYCVCSKPYPCEEFEGVDMFQCCVCEDWLHSIHLGPVSAPEDNSTYESMACPACLAAHPILLRYYDRCSVKKMESSANGEVKEENVAAVSLPVDVKEESVEKKEEQKEDLSNGHAEEACEESASESVVKMDAKVEDDESPPSSSAVATDAEPGVGLKRPHDEDGEPEAKRAKKDVEGEKEASAENDQPVSSNSVEGPASEGCIMPAEDELVAKALSAKVSAFWAKNWREQLCRCEACKKMFEEDGLGFLLDPEDSMDAYVRKGQDKSNGTSAVSSSSDLSNALAGLNRFALVETVHAYSDMSSKLMDYLRPFAESGRVVTPADINEFFSRLREQNANRGSEVLGPCR